MPAEKKYSWDAIDRASENGHIDMRTCAEWWFTSPNAPAVKKYSEVAIDRASENCHIDMRTCAEW